MEKEEYKIKIDKSKCISCGGCIATCPELFEWGEDGKSKLKKEVITKNEYPCVKKAIDICPVGAITIEEE